MKTAKRLPPRCYLDPDLVAKIAQYLDQQTEIIVMAYGSGPRRGTRGGVINDMVAAAEVNNLRQWRWLLKRAVARARRLHNGEFINEQNTTVSDAGVTEAEPAASREATGYRR